MRFYFDSKKMKADLDSGIITATVADHEKDLYRVTEVATGDHWYTFIEKSGLLAPHQCPSLTSAYNMKLAHFREEKDDEATAPFGS